MLLDETMGAIIHEEDLYEESWTVTGPAAVQWSLTGLALTAGPGGFAEVVFDTLSDWIVDPLNGSASLENGIFSASGDLENLDWIIGSSGDLITAFLPSSELSPFFDFTIQATGLMDLPESVSIQLVAQEQGYAAAAVVVSEPSALALLGTALLGLLLSAQAGKSHRTGRLRRREG